MRSDPLEGCLPLLEVSLDLGMCTHWWTVDGGRAAPLDSVVNSPRAAKTIKLMGESMPQAGGRSMLKTTALSVPMPSASCEEQDHSSPRSRSQSQSQSHRTHRSLHRRASIKQPWTQEQDSQLSVLVEAHGRGRWSAVASTLGSRSPKQCRERWLNHLDPSISRRVWTREEDDRLFELHDQFGNAWARIADELPGRTDNSVKNHWHSASTQRLLRRRQGSSLSWSNSDCDSLSRSPSPHKMDQVDDNSAAPAHSRSGVDEAESSRRTATSPPRRTATSPPRRTATSPPLSTGDSVDYTLHKDALQAFLDAINFDELVDGADSDWP